MSMRCSCGIHDGRFCFHPWSGHCAAYGTGSNADTRIAAYPLHLPSIRQGVDIQHSLVFGKPYWGLDWRPIPFDTLKVKIALPHKGGQVWAMHSNTFMRDTDARCLVTLYQDAGYHEA